MRIGIDMTALLPEPTGVDVYMLSILQELARMDPVDDYFVFVNGVDRRPLRAGLPHRFRVVAASARPRPCRLLFQQALLPAAAVLLGLDVVYSPAFIAPLIRGRPRHVLTVHDMTSFTLPGYHIPLRASAAYRYAVALSIRRVDIVTVPSDYVRGELLRILPDTESARVRVVREGVGEDFQPIESVPARRVAASLGISRPYVLHVGTLEPRKNLTRLVRAYRNLLARCDVDLDLVLAGRLGWNYHALLSELDAVELRGRVHQLGYVRREDLPSLYAAATMCAYPSLEEGFGLPPLEAMACGTPVIASRCSALVENLQGAAELVEPTDVGALEQAMARLLTDPDLRASRVRQGLERVARFRWSQSARSLVACFHEAVER